MLCGWCGCFFCPEYLVDSRALQDVPTLYCLPGHGKKASDARRKARLAAADQQDRLLRLRYGPGCRRKKHRFRSAAKARQALIEIQNRAPGTVRSYYRCLNPPCPYWHLSSQLPDTDTRETCDPG